MKWYATVKIVDVDSESASAGRARKCSLVKGSDQKFELYIETTVAS